MAQDRTILFRLSTHGEPVNNDGVNNGVLILPSIALPKNYKQGDVLFTLQFHLNAASRVSNKGVLKTNVPNKPDVPYDRNSYYNYNIATSFNKDTIIDVDIYQPGVYNYYIDYKDEESGEEKTTEKYYFNVPPNLTINDKFIPFNALNVESVVSKWIGSYDKWNQFFKLVSQKGYNMIHFTPLQERGESDSPYSIYDQLKLDPKIFKDNAKAPEQIQSVLKENNLLSLTDVVWNHTANNSKWLHSSPNSGYNQDTAPHLIAAIELDEALLDFSTNLEKLGLPTEIKTESDLGKIIDSIDKHVLGELKLWQFYIYDKKSTIEQLENDFNKHDAEKYEVSNLDIKELAKQVKETPIIGHRFENKLNIKKLLSLLLNFGDDFNVISQNAEKIIDELNVDLYATYDDDVKSIKQQVGDRIKFLRLADNGPKLGPITEKLPLTEPYFTRFTDDSGKKQALANNGWIWGGNPLVDFASDKSKAYLRREVIVWGDCVKLRYGDKYEDSPETWKRMIEYTKASAKVFNGFRIDNCHSTPLHVGERLLDEARKINPNLYIIAELFSGSEEMDKIFVERLGINSLIREAMQAWNTGELSRLVHKHGGRPIGSLTWLPLDDFAYPQEATRKFGGYTELDIPKALIRQQPHAIFFDCTHDNEMPNQKRTVEDTLTNAALVAFCSSAIGSVFGYDECYPYLLNVVHEKRHYELTENGIGKVKSKLYKIREDLSRESEDILRDHEMYIHHEGQYITIQRYNARTGKGWFLIARTKFGDEGPQVLSPCILAGTEVKHEFSYKLVKSGDYDSANDKILTGIPVTVEEFEPPSVESNNGEAVIKVDDAFAPGSISVFSLTIPGVDISIDNFVKEGAIDASTDLDLYDLNALLYRASPEELDASGGKDDVYDIPKYGKLVYAGLEGWNSVLKNVIWTNDLGSPICDHLREGEWAIDYIINRLDKYVSKSKNLGKFQDWLRSRFDKIREIPYFLRPHYFALIVGIGYEAARFRALKLMDEEIQTSTNFVQSLALTSIQMCGYMNNTSLLPDRSVPCLAAGLPHFSNDYMRCWGRDVFISFRGLLIVTGRFEDAKAHILGFAKTLKHGLMPNLLDAGRNPRYNARDAVWFFLQAIQEYITYVPNGVKILDEKVTRRFPKDDTYIKHEDAFKYETSIRDIIYEIFQRHAKGIKYREANAGPNLDSQMTDEGFNVEIYVDWNTGFVNGGNEWNCGTWMDKMGESVRAGNKGYPGTPRNGAPIELQGLLKSALRFVNKLHDDGHFKYTEVEKDSGKISFKEWEELIQNNFEKYYYIPEDPKDDEKYVIQKDCVNRRGIYKDLTNTSKKYEEYQLRANFPITMCVAPELFTKEKAIKCLEIADQSIRGPYGIATLDPSDYNYRPYYNNSIDNDDFATSKGRNYHQGPEWLWPAGYFLRAMLKFNNNKNQETTFTTINSRLDNLKQAIKESPWAGLTELTNKDGAYCQDSSPTQAWSSSCLLDLYYDVYKSE